MPKKTDRSGLVPEVVAIPTAMKLLGDKSLSKIYDAIGRGELVAKKDGPPSAHAARTKPREGCPQRRTPRLATAGFGIASILIWQDHGVPILKLPHLCPVFMPYMLTSDGRPLIAA
jgi:hypothetical protein